jgi:hypothetical protein
MVNRLFRGVVHQLVKGDQPAANVALSSTSNESCDHHSSMGSSVTEQRGSTVLSSSGFLPTSLFPQIFKKRKLRKLKVLGFMPIMALLLTPMVFSGSAFGAQTRKLVRSFGTLSSPQGIGVDDSSGASSSGFVYVADAGSHRVQEFTSEGVFVLMFGDDVNKSPLGGMPDEENVCRAGEECQAGVSESAPGAFETPKFVAVDNDPTSPSFHDVYVADTGDNLVSKFSPEGVLEKTWGTKGQLDGSTTTAGSFGSIAGIAVGATGTLYVMNAEGPSHVFEFEPGSAFTSEVEPLEKATSAVGFAVDGEGDLFKVNPFVGIMIFTASGGETSKYLTNGGPKPGAFTVGPEGGIYSAATDETLDHYEFNGSGEVIGPGASPPCPVTESGCTPTDSTPAGFVGSGIGVASGGDVFLSDAAAGEVVEYGSLVTLPDVVTGLASEKRPTSARLNGSVNPEGLPVTECAFEYGETTGYGNEAACVAPAAGELSGSSPVPVHAVVEGLSPGVTYHFRLVARNASDSGHGATPNPGVDGSFETPPPPSIDSATVSGLSGSGAVLNASINPQSAVTRYHFEYDTRPYVLGEAGHGVRLPAVEGEDPSLAAGGSDVSVSRTISGLSANVTYYWRVLAGNASGVTTGVGRSFVYETAGRVLADGRAYEMVTPDHKNGSLIGDVSFVGLEPDIAASGQRVMSMSIQCFAGSESCNAEQADAIGSPFEFTRTSGGWVARALSPPASEFLQSASWAYSAQEGTALLSMPTAPSREDDLYVREAATGRFVDIGPDTPPEDGPHGPHGGHADGSEVAHTADFSHVAWDASYQWSAPFNEPNGTAVYEYAGVGNTRPLQVGVSGGEDSNALVSDCGTLLGGYSQAFYAPGLMSVDGRTVFFTALPAGSGVACAGSLGGVPVFEVFARVGGEAAGAHTVAVSTLSPSACGAGGGAGEVSCRAAEAQPAGAAFMGASEDGADAFFLSTQQLTDGASEDPDSKDSATEEGGTNRCSRTVGANGCNLYMLEGVTAEKASERRLVDVSEGEGVVAGGPRVQGVMAVPSKSGSERVYFVAKGVLTGSERPGCMAEWTAVGRGGEADCHAVDGANNLYVYDRVSHSLQFIAIMAPAEADESQWEAEPGKPANVTPDGRFLVFLSHGDVTADDTSRSHATQVFRYDAVTGGLLRVSIGNAGFNDNGNRSSSAGCEFDGILCMENAGIARSSRASRPDPSMSDDGSRVFFESPIALTAHALDEVQVATAEEIYGFTGLSAGLPVFAQNVYEWEAGGVGACPVSRGSGCVFLISDGRDVSVNRGAAGLCAHGSSVCLLGSDATGGNVFFTTTNSLVASDTNTELDYYDARVCEPENGNPCVEAAGPGGPGCAGEECRGLPGVAPGAPSPPSGSFSGPGNMPSSGVVKRPSRHEMLVKALRSCRAKHKHNRKRRVACERVAQHAFGTKKASAKKTSAGASSGARGRVSRRGGW